MRGIPFLLPLPRNDVVQMKVVDEDTLSDDANVVWDTTDVHHGRIKE